MYFVPLERIQGLNDDLSQLSRVRLLAEAHFGQAAAAPFDAIHKAYKDVAVAARMLVTTVGELKPSDPNKARWEATIWNVGDTDDHIAGDVAKAVSALEGFCRPHLAEGSRALSGSVKLVTWGLVALILLLLVGAALQAAYPELRGTAAVGQRVRQDCTAIMDEIVDYAASMNQPMERQTYERGVLQCLLQSATRGR